MSTFTETLFLAIYRKGSTNAKYDKNIQIKYFLYVRYAFAFRHWMHHILGCPSVLHASVLPSVQLTIAQVTYQPTDFPSICLPIRPERFPCICLGTHGLNGLKWGMLIYPDHHQNWLGSGHGLLIFLLLAPLWLNEIVRFEFSRYLFRNAWIDGSTFGMMMTWPSTDLARFWPGPANLPLVGATFSLVKMFKFEILRHFCEYVSKNGLNLICWCILRTFRND